MPLQSMVRHTKSGLRRQDERRFIKADEKKEVAVGVKPDPNRRLEGCVFLLGASVASWSSWATA